MIRRGGVGPWSDCGPGARLARRLRDAGSDERLHWNRRAHCYVRRTKKQVLPQLPAKRQDTVPILLSNEREYRLAEQDVNLDRFLDVEETLLYHGGYYGLDKESAEQRADEMIDVLPPPVAPTRATFSPARTRKEIFFSTGSSAR